MNYLEEYITEHPDRPPHEHVIVFDEAQRAWDAEYGRRKFNRAASEPELFLEIMGRHHDWSVIIALVGGGQEINTGEGGLAEWGAALQKRANENSDNQWEVYAAPQVVSGGQETVGQRLFSDDVSYEGLIDVDRQLHLPVSVRAYKCEAVTNWVNEVITGNSDQAFKIAREVEDFPIFLTRSLNTARTWLKRNERGTRRCGLVASSGARRLRAEGLGVSLSAMELDAVKHWYLQARGDIRSSCALEVTANEYTCQGLELDYVGVCWGGDMLWVNTTQQWKFRKLIGGSWSNVRRVEAQNFNSNTYRVLMTRARLGMVIWVPEGEKEDPTRDPIGFNETARFLTECGATLI